MLESRLLIVDDEYSIREALKLFFDGKGFKTEIAVNGLEAIDFIEKEDFDIVVSDVRMDKIDGLALLKKIKEYNRKMPVILITAYADLNGAIEALRNGASEYVIKPFNMEAMAEKVDKVLKLAKDTSEETYVKKYEEQKVDFITRFSHELRTPLTPVYGYISLMLKKEFGEIPIPQMEVVKTIHKNSKRLKRIIDDLIMIYYIDYMNEIPVIQKYEIVKLIDDTLKEEDEVIKKKNQAVEIKIYDGIETVDCDRDKMKRVLFHLIDNAVKFSPASSKIIIEISNFEHRGKDHIKFSVKDNSVRLKTNKRLIFRQFYEFTSNADDPFVSKEIKGMGIGLTLSKSIVELHGGKIWIESEGEDLLSGNTFSFILPIVQLRK